jgi:hypothetical protein
LKSTPSSRISLLAAGAIVYTENSGEGNRSILHRQGSMNSRDTIINIWNALIVFFAAMYLTDSVFKAGLAAIVVFVSCAIGYGRLWQLRAGFAVGVLAFAVAFGVVPKPQTWPNFVSEIWTMAAACFR